MRYVSIDIETTGLNPSNCDIIEFAAVVDDLSVQNPIEKLPTFQTYVLRDSYRGDPYALAMHSEIFKKIAKWKEGKINVCEPKNLLNTFITFLTTLGGYETTPVKINVAGKNFANFDNKFLSLLPDYYKVKINHRIIDPAILYFEPFTDKELPNTETCLKRAGLEATVTHTALEDALLVVKLLRHKFKLPSKIEITHDDIPEEITLIPPTFSEVVLGK